MRFYHATKKANVDSIFKDGYIRAGSWISQYLNSAIRYGKGNHVLCIELDLEPDGHHIQLKDNVRVENIVSYKIYNKPTTVFDNS